MLKLVPSVSGTRIFRVSRIFSESFDRIEEQSETCNVVTVVDYFFPATTERNEVTLRFSCCILHDVFRIDFDHVFAFLLHFYFVIPRDKSRMPYKPLTKGCNLYASTNKVVARFTYTCLSRRNTRVTHWQFQLQNQPSETDSPLPPLVLRYYLRSFA